MFHPSSQFNPADGSSIFLRSADARCHIYNLTALSLLSVSLDTLWPRIACRHNHCADCAKVQLNTELKYALQRDRRMKMKNNGPGVKGTA